LQLSYRSYWYQTIVEILLNRVSQDGDPVHCAVEEEDEHDTDTRVAISVMELCELTSIKKDDVLSTLQLYEMYNYLRGDYVITLTAEMIDAYQKAMQKRQLRIDPKLIRYCPKDWPKVRMQRQAQREAWQQMAAAAQQ